MPDREMVVKGLECCLPEHEYEGNNPCIDCPYDHYEHGSLCGSQQLLRDALELLREQEPVKPTRRLVYTTRGWFCGACDKRLNRAGKYCSYCGKAVKWDAAD